ncbi:DNA methyltransferase [Paenibacillus sp. BIHB 4019]|uniref:DNA methyltransferase n=1 Tax=Paenibacillus sp. BIHB 4019 TaxID=1870819 RepID=A0A1B2DDU8_9BACL|nr:MGMT family protein [Paenibacillus sp. BIHB 4019]ANY65879.1 DNA methyltransferase [Paenibacillus sp. BIHB 4019]
MQPFTKRVIEIIKRIPAGAVMSYGQIAELAGSRRGARQVVRILHTQSSIHRLPWHRVVNAQGEIAIPSEEGNMEQRSRLEEEGIEVSVQGKLDLAKYRFNPAPADIMGAWDNLDPDDVDQMF